MRVSMRMAAVLAVAVAGCTSVPGESVELSRLVAEMIASAKASHVGLVHRHFDQRAAAVDAFAMGEYKKKFLENVLRLLQKRDPAMKSLTLEQYDAAMTRVFRLRDEWQQEVRKGRQAVLQALEQHYALLQAAQAELTALLRSAANLNETKGALLQRLGEKVGVSGAKVREIEDGLSQGLGTLDSILGDALKKLGEEQ